MVLISERPAEVEDRAVPGHWEGDLILGSKRTCIGTLVERSTRFVMLLRLQDGTAEEVRKAMTKRIRTLPPELRRSVTWDSHNARVPGRKSGLTRRGIGFVPCLGSVDLSSARGRAPAGRTDVT